MKPGHIVTADAKRYLQAIETAREAGWKLTAGPTAPAVARYVFSNASPTADFAALAQRFRAMNTTAAAMDGADVAVNGYQSMRRGLKPGHIVTDSPEAFTACIVAAGEKGWVLTAGPDPGQAKYVFTDVAPEVDCHAAAAKLQRLGIPGMPVGSGGRVTNTRVRDTSPDNASVPGGTCLDTAVIAVHHGRDDIRVTAHRTAMQHWREQKPHMPVYFAEIIYDGGETSFPEFAAWPELHHIIIRGEDRHRVLFQKEAVYNHIVRTHVPRSVKYLIFVDCDAWSEDVLWFSRIRAKLASNPKAVVQGFEKVWDTGDGHWMVYSYASRPVTQKQSWHGPGLIWGMTRDVFDERRGWNPWGVVGCGDCLFVLENETEQPEGIKPPPGWMINVLRDDVPSYPMDWVPVTVVHEFHGTHRSRNYGHRWTLFDEFGLRMMHSVYVDSNGLLAWRDPAHPVVEALERICTAEQREQVGAIVADVCKGKPASWYSTPPVEPTFVIGGVMKCGTSALALNLARHPDIWMLDKTGIERMGRKAEWWNECHFFDRDSRYPLGTDWYLDHFSQACGSTVIGEHSPNCTTLGVYTTDDPLSRIACNFPSMKLVVLLRDPVERAYSHWYHVFRKFPEYGYELPFDDILTSDFPAADHILATGRYDTVIARALKWFGTRVVFGIMERLDGSIEEHRRICECLGADGQNLPDAACADFAHIRRSGERPSMNDNTRAALREYYADSVTSSRAMLGDRIAEWN